MDRPPGLSLGLTSVVLRAPGKDGATADPAFRDSLSALRHPVGVRKVRTLVHGFVAYSAIVALFERFAPRSVVRACQRVNNRLMIPVLGWGRGGAWSALMSQA